MIMGLLLNDLFGPRKKKKKNRRKNYILIFSHEINVRIHDKKIIFFIFFFTEMERPYKSNMNTTKKLESKISRNELG